MKQKKQFRELSDEELEQVTGGAGIDCSLDMYKNLPECNGGQQLNYFRPS